MGTLYLVSTPIGNLDDITIRALKVLFSVDGIACEDTRKTGQMLKVLRERYQDIIPQLYNKLVYYTGSEKADIKDKTEQRLISYYEQNEFRRIPDIVTALKNNLSIALLSDAGTPAVSDPGFRLVTACIEEEIPVVPVPGASSVLASLVASGLPTDKFLFLGYPPHKEGKRKQLYKGLLASKEHLSATYILFEAPHKLLKTLQELHSIFGDIELVTARELTKIHEEFRRGKISTHTEHFTKSSPKGEFVLLFHL